MHGGGKERAREVKTVAEGTVEKDKRGREVVLYPKGKKQGFLVVQSKRGRGADILNFDLLSYAEKGTRREEKKDHCVE
jgi:hypothetical protein